MSPFVTQGIHSLKCFQCVSPDSPLQVLSHPYFEILNPPLLHTLYKANIIINTQFRPGHVFHKKILSLIDFKFPCVYHSWLTTHLILDRVQVC